MHHASPQVLLFAPKKAPPLATHRSAASRTAATSFVWVLVLQAGADSDLVDLVGQIDFSPSRAARRRTERRRGGGGGRLASRRAREQRYRRRRAMSTRRRRRVMSTRQRRRRRTSIGRVVRQVRRVRQCDRLNRWQPRPCPRARTGTRSRSRSRAPPFCVASIAVDAKTGRSRSGQSRAPYLARHCRCQSRTGGCVEGAERAPTSRARSARTGD